MQVPNSVCEPSFMVRLRHLPTLQKAQENVAPKPLAKNRRGGNSKARMRGAFSHMALDAGLCNSPKGFRPMPAQCQLYCAVS